MAHPLFERELIRSSRNRRTYVLRSAVAASGILILILNLILAGENLSGTVYFAAIEYLLFFFCIVEGIRATSDCLSEEERERTLGLLFLTELNGFEVVLGKLASQGSSCFYNFLGLLPLSGLALLFGGVTGQQFLRTNVVLIGFLFLCLACGMFVSSRSVHEGRAGCATAGLILGLCILPFVGLYWKAPDWISILSPWRLLISNLTNSTSAPMASFLVSLLPLFLISFVLVWFAGRRIERFRSTVHPQTGSSPRVDSMFFSLGKNAILRQQCLEFLPVRYLFLRARRMNAAMIMVGCAVLGLDIFAAVRGDFHFSAVCILVSLACLQILLMVVSYRIVDAFHSLRSTGTLEILQTGPVSNEELFRSCHIVLLQSLRIPLALVGLGLVVNLASGNNYPDYASDAAPEVIITALLFVAEFPSIKWVSMYFGLLDRKKNAAFLKAVFLVIILPLLCAPFPGWNVLAFIIALPFWYQWGSHKVRKSMQNWPSNSSSFSSLK
ncbi:MAG: hypothetical protein JWM04_475 [Verrucomicrobiales bacterium]|nr:hypothetical protein [Verrucomicrobiales bacterium]